MSEDDTEATKKQIDRQNLAHECLCQKKSEICKEAGF